MHSPNGLDGRKHSVYLLLCKCRRGESLRRTNRIVCEGKEPVAKRRAYARAAPDLRPVDVVQQRAFVSVAIALSAPRGVDLSAPEGGHCRHTKVSGGKAC
jgi:hypothetical protein